jgi:organic hydroperoxide reductase OsmC/OhrA
MLKISAKVRNSQHSHQVTLQTNDHSHSIVIPPKPDGIGSNANGGEVLFLALATCYCNDIYREAAKLGIKVERVEVVVEGEFGDPGQPASNVSYRAAVAARASQQEIRDLMKHTDRVAEIQNTLRIGTPVELSSIEAISLE